jgi:integrase
MFLELSAATGARRGEVLALRWSASNGSDIVITRSLTQTRQALESSRERIRKDLDVCFTGSVLISLAAHRTKLDRFRQFGTDYRADLYFDIC